MHIITKLILKKIIININHEPIVSTCKKKLISCHNVVAIISDITHALYTGWVAKLNFQVSLPDELSAKVVIASRLSVNPEKPNKALQS